MECLDAAFRKMSEEQGHNMGKASEDMLAVMASFGMASGRTYSPGHGHG